MIYGLLVFVHIVICFFLVIVVLLQSGKAADLAGAFGGMGSQTAFGPRGTASLLSKLTRYAATLFMITSLSLAILGTRGANGPGTTILEEQQPARGSQPAQSRPANQPPVHVQFPQGGKTVTFPIKPNSGPPAQAPAAPAQRAPAAPANK